VTHSFGKVVSGIINPKILMYAFSEWKRAALTFFKISTFLFHWRDWGKWWQNFNFWV